MSSGDGLGPDAACGQQLADWQAKAEAERAEMREAITTLASAVALLLHPAPAPPGVPVPQALARALDGPRSSTPVQVPLRMPGRSVAVWVTGGCGTDAAQVWDAIARAVPAEAETGCPHLVRVPLPAGVIAVVDGPRWTVSTAAGGTDRAALAAALRQARAAGAAVPAAAWAGLRAAPHLRLAAAAVRSHVPAAAAASGVAAAAGITLVFAHPLSHGGLPPGAALAPAVSGISPQAGPRASGMSFTMPGAAGRTGGVPAAAGTLGAAASHRPPVSTPLPGIPVTWPASPPPVTVTRPPSPPATVPPPPGRRGQAAVAGRTVRQVTETVRKVAAGLARGLLGHKAGLSGLPGL